MAKHADQLNFSEKMAELLPSLRRHARSLTGSQASGDAMAIATFEAVLGDRSAVMATQKLSTGLFRVCHRVWMDGGSQAQLADDPAFRRAQEHLSKLTPLRREALLLHTIEDFDAADIAEILELPDATAAMALVDKANDEMKAATAGRMLIIEDEFMIAMDLAEMLTSMGHDVIGTAATYDEAITMAKGDRPDLILSDIKLADGSLGTDAVHDILKIAGQIPVIFITAYSELLLTGENPEPAFLIAKPYSIGTVSTAVSQAMFFASADAINV